MADLHHLPNAALDAPKAAQPTAVQGWNCETLNDPGYCAVIVNPAAPNSALADWARAHVEQVSALQGAMSKTRAPASGVDLTLALAALYHFQQQAAAVLRELSERLQQGEADALAKESDHG